MINNMQILGRVGKINTQYSKSGSMVVNLSIATNKKIKNANGDKEIVTEWHHVTAFNKLAEIISEYVKKGELLYVEGEMKYEKYLSKDGTERNKATVMAKDIKMIPQSKKSESESGNYNQLHKPDFNDDQIPF